MSDVEIERLDGPAALDAVPALAALLVDAVAHGAALGFVGALDVEPAQAWWRAEVLPAMASEAVSVLGAFEDDRLLGAAVVRPDPRAAAPTAATLSLLLVHSGVRLRGVGRALLSAAEGAALDGGRTLMLTEVVAQSGAEQLLASAGWMRIGRVADRLLLPNGVPVTASLMQRRLGPRTVEMSSRVRGARLADAPRLGEVHVRAWQEYYRGHMPDEFLDQLDPLLRETQLREKLTYPQPADRIWVVERDGEAMGFAVTGTSRDADAVTGAAEIFALYVDPAACHAGLGRLLLRHAVDDMGRRGARTVNAWVFDGSARGRRLVAAAGFRPEPMERTFTAMGEILHEQRMRLTVGDPGA